MAGLGIAIYTDEMVYAQLAAALRARGYDATSCAEAGRVAQEISDDDQLSYAATKARAILTENMTDFYALDALWKASGKTHAGIILYTRVRTFGELFRRIVAHLDTIEPQTQHDTLLWLR